MTAPVGPGADPDGFDQAAMIHRLPPAVLVDRIGWLRQRCRGRRTVHVGFVDAGCQAMQAGAGTWLHAHLGEVTSDLVGVDLDVAGVAAAVADGWEAHVLDVRDAAAVMAAGIAPAEVVVAGEVIEHLDDPGSFLDGLHALVAPGGDLVVTTPNACGLLNVAAALGGYELNHPDHVVMFTWRTLTTLLARHGWATVETCTYVPVVKPAEAGTPARLRLLGAGARVVVGVERLLGAMGRPFAADGLIVVARSAR